MRKAILTIDDSPTSLTPDLVDFLHERKIESIFFCIGSSLQCYPHEADKIVQADYLIGNHGFSHRAFSTLSIQECLEEILKTETEIERVYQRNSVKRPKKLFRFPYGDKGGKLKADIQSELYRHEFKQVDAIDITYSWYFENSLHSDLDIFWTSIRLITSCLTEFHLSLKRIYMIILRKFHQKQVEVYQLEQAMKSY